MMLASAITVALLGGSSGGGEYGDDGDGSFTPNEPPDEDVLDDDVLDDDVLDDDENEELPKDDEPPVELDVLDVLDRKLPDDELELELERKPPEELELLELELDRDPPPKL